jgi:hypothetical protein
MAAKEESSDGFKKVSTSSNSDDDDAEWIDLTNEKNDAFTESVEGEVREVKDNCGKYDSRIYKISRGPGDTVIFWGNASLDTQFDEAGLGPGDVIRFVNTGETYETKSGHSGVRFDVFAK